MEIKGLDIDGIKLSTTTNILDIEVPAWLEERIESGIPWFDEALAGGFLATQVCMFTGVAGAGKTTMSLQLADSITASGNACLYNTREESLAQVALKVKELGLKSGFICSQHSFADDLLAHADKLKTKNNHVIIIQDSLPALDDGFYRGKPKSKNYNTPVFNSATPMRAAKKLTEWAKQKHGTAVFINHVTKGGDYAGKSGVKHVVDTHIHMDLDTDDNSRSLLITKNRFGATSAKYIIGMGQTGLSLLHKIDSAQPVHSDPEAQEELAAASAASEKEPGKKRNKRRHNLRAV